MAAPPRTNHPEHQAQDTPPESLPAPLQDPGPGSPLPAGYQRPPTLGQVKCGAPPARVREPRRGQYPPAKQPVTAAHPLNPYQGPPVEQHPTPDKSRLSKYPPPPQ